MQCSTRFLVVLSLIFGTFAAPMSASAAETSSGKVQKAPQVEEDEQGEESDPEQEMDAVERPGFWLKTAGAIEIICGFGLVGFGGYSISQDYVGSGAVDIGLGAGLVVLGSLFVKWGKNRDKRAGVAALEIPMQSSGTMHVGFINPSLNYDLDQFESRPIGLMAKTDLLSVSW